MQAAQTRSVLVPALLVAVISGGCATGYQPTGFAGGFSETQLSENVYQVRFNGNGFTTSERASDFALLRSADVCLRDGYRYFIVADAESSEKIGTYTTPIQSTTQGLGTVIGTNVYSSSTTTTTGGQTYVISKPGHSMLVAFYNTPPNDLGFVYDARFIDASVREKYGLPRRVSD